MCGETRSFLPSALAPRAARYASAVGTIAEELSGAEVYSVEFVRDYVQLHLEAESDEPATGGGYHARIIHISAITDPEVRRAGIRLRKRDPGWRDAVCELLNTKVRDASISDEEFRVEFDTDLVLTVSLRDADYRAPEAVTVSGIGEWVL